MSPSLLQNVFLTGANGFVGSHILQQLLTRPQTHVRAVVRSQAKADQVRSDFPGASSRLTFAIVPDITASGAFDHAFENADPPFDTVIHTASPFLFKGVSSNLELLEPAVKGTTEILTATKKLAPEVQRVVITSSFAAIADAKLPADAGKIYTSEDWNPITWEEAVEGDIVAGYMGSKKYAEKAAWDFLSKETPHYEIVALNPPMVYGPLAHTIKDLSSLNQSNGPIYAQYVNSKKDAPLPPNGVHVHVDVRDLARAHISAATTESAGNKRFLITRGRIPAQEISDILRAGYPNELANRTPVGPHPGISSLGKGAYDADAKTGQEALGLAEMKSNEATFVDLAKQLLKLEKGDSYETDL